MEPQDKEDKSVKEHWRHYRCPTGVSGRTVAANMNKEHWDLTTWGLKYVKIKSLSVIVDVGCGGGKTINRLARRAVQSNVYGIDHSADMVEYSKRFNKKLIEKNRVEIFKASVEKTVFKGELFDLVTAIETYYFWPNLAQAFQEIKRILKKGGCLLIISEMIKDGVFEVENAEIIAKTQVHLVPLQEIQRMLYSAGFSSVKVFKKRKSDWNAVLAYK
jgi:ubiquinone/menaquinone biosynthesis C-methylase UbiE